MEFQRAYDDMFYNDKKGFELMNNSADALILQFREPAEFDLPIPGAYDIKRLLYLFQEGFDGNIIDYNLVDCCIGTFPDRGRNFKLDFGDKFPTRVKEGLELCFKTKDKYDTYPIHYHLRNTDVFGNEGSYYRFRNGMKEEVLSRVKNYFNKDELSAFEQIGKFIQPYVPNLHRSHPLNDY